MARSILFVHTPRSAGMSIHDVFRKARPGWSMLAAGLYQMPPFREQVQSGQPYYLGGHFTLEQAESLTGANYRETVNFVTVRNPVERIISEYHYLKMNAPMPGYPLSLFENGIEGYIDHRLVHSPLGVSNLQCWQIVGQPSDHKTALARLEEHFNFAATEAKLTELVEAVATMADQPWKEKPVYAGRTNEAPRDGEIAPAVRQRLMDLNREDYELWRFVGGHGGFWRNPRRA